MFCPECGKEIASNSKFCIECGAKLGKDSTNNEVIEKSPELKLPKRKISKKPIIIMALVVVVCIGSFFSVNTIIRSNRDYRNINWGMTRDQVKRAESAELIKEYDGKLYYTVYDWEGLEGESVDIVYFFDKGLLYCVATYLGDDLDFYVSLHEFYTSRYGSPKPIDSYDEVMWRTETKKITSSSDPYWSFVFYDPDYVSEYVPK